jgi:outer membrane immunogenic protein
MFRKLLLASAGLLAIAAAAQAADLPYRAAPPVYAPPPPIFTWTGAYVGAQIGYEFGSDHARVPGLPGVGSTPNGVVGGAHVGYNYQIGMFVAGIEGDMNGANYHGGTFYPTIGAGANSRVGIDGSARGRVGLAFDRALVYATGGAAFAGLQNSYVGPGGAFSQFNHSSVGWTVGGGLEYAVTNNWSIRAEYRYTDYGRVTDFPAAVPVVHHDTDNRLQAGFSYKFDMFSPIAAKY